MTNQAQRALSALTRRERDILPLIERLVRINSHTGNVAGVDAVGDVLTEVLAPLPLELEVMPGGELGKHLCFRTPAAREQPSIVLIGHHDTVFPPGTFETYSVSGDVARGPGVLDMKGGLSIVATVLAALAEAELLSRMPLTFVTVSDEEVGSPSSRAHLQKLAASARCALVFEAGRAGDAIITSRRGAGHATVEAHGRAAHAGNALNDGRNAILALARFIDRAEALTDVPRGISVNVGLVHGGTARNTVPDYARCEADLRFGDAEGEQALISQLELAARDAAASVPGVSLEMTVDISRKPWTRANANVALCERYAVCQRESGLEASESARVGGGSDANTVGTLGVPAIDGLGPRGAGFHTLDEHIEISSLPKKAHALLRFLLRELGIEQQTA